MRYLGVGVAAATAALVSLGAALTDGTVTAIEWVQVGVALLGALGAAFAPSPSTPRPSAEAVRLLSRPKR